MNTTRKYIGTIMAALVVLSAFAAIGIPATEAEDTNDNSDPVLFGYVGVSETHTVGAQKGMADVTVYLYKAFDLFGTEPLTTSTNNFGYYSFSVEPGQYLLGVETKRTSDMFYYLNTSLYAYSAGDKIEVNLLEQGVNTRLDASLAVEGITAHFYGKILGHNGLPLNNAVVSVWDVSTGFSASDNTGTDGIYSIDVYNGTFEMSVTVDSIQRYYNNSVSAVGTSGIESGDLTKTYHDGLVVKVNNMIHEDFEHVGQTVTVDGLKNRDKATATYKWLNETDEEKGLFEQDEIVSEFNVTLDMPRYEIISVAFHNDTGWFDVEAANYTYEEATRKLFIDQIVNGTLFVNYTFVDSITDTLVESAGRNEISDIQLSRNKLSGTLLNSKALPLEGVHTTIILYNLDTNQASTKLVTGPTFLVDVSTGEYILVIQPEGYVPYVRTDLDISGDTDLDDDLMFSKAESEAGRVTHMVFDDDWNDLEVTWEITLDSWAHLAGLGDDFRNIRLQIDHVFGNGDGMLTTGEIDAFRTAIHDMGVEFVSTKNLFTFNNTIYEFAGDYTVAVDVGTGTIANHDPVTITMTASYASAEDIALGEEEYPATLSVEENTGIYHIYLLPGYARSDDPLTNKPQEGSENAVYVEIDSSETYHAEMTIKKMAEPVAHISVDAYPIVAREDNMYVVKNGTIVTFNGGGSMVEDGQITEYNWTVGEEGDWLNVPEWSEDSEFEFNFTESSSVAHNVTLWVLDTSGNINWTTVWIIPDGDAPVPQIAVNITDNEAGQNELIEFNATGSSDAVSDYDNLTFFWDFGDGVISTGDVAEHYYDMPGTYVVYLNVTDEMGNVGSSSLTITILDTNPPVARVNVERNVVEGRDIVFNASESQDIEGNITGYMWDFGDGTVTGWLTEYTINHTYANPGTFNATLTVRDEAGNEANTTVAMNVRPGPRPDIAVMSITVDGDPVRNKEVNVLVVIKNLANVSCGDQITVILLEGTTEVGRRTISGIDGESETTVTFTWKPSTKGTVFLTANATCDRELQTTLFDNVRTESVEVDPTAMERYGVTIIVLVVIVLLVVLLFGRDKIKDMLASRQKASEKPEKKEKKDKKEK